MTLRCQGHLVAETISALQAAGAHRREGIVLWLASRGAPGDVKQVLVPLHFAEEDRFWLPPEAMRALMRHLRENRLALVAQVHSHPKAAFHSKADDEWAIVRHEGALSIVVSYFAEAMTTENFLSRSAIYRLHTGDRWIEVAPAAIRSAVEVVS